MDDSKDEEDAVTGTDENTDEKEPTTTEDVVSERQAELDRLPDRSPLSTTLEDFFAAEDREEFAATADVIDYRNGAVKVSITLEPDGERPDQYLPEDTSGYGDTIIAYVDADDLVDLALDENVRMVSLPSQPQTHDRNQ